MWLRLQPLAKEIPKLQTAENRVSRLQAYIYYCIIADVTSLSVYFWSHQKQKKGQEDFWSDVIQLALQGPLKLTIQNNEC